MNGCPYLEVGGGAGEIWLEGVQCDSLEGGRYDGYVFLESGGHYYRQEQ
ncbi:MAG: hypothetical protein WD208_02070 [Dehalococcoidia bacterium]